MELPRGLQKSLPKVNETKPAEIKCPVVENFKHRSAGRIPQIERPLPDSLIKIPYDPKLSLLDLEEYWIASAVKHYKGNLSIAAKALGIGRATIYKKMQKMYR